MTALVGSPAEVSFTLSITRAATGLVETFDMVGYIDPTALAAAQSTEPLEIQNVSNPHLGSTDQHL